jgi:hypothetical protein
LFLKYFNIFFVSKSRELGFAGAYFRLIESCDVFTSRRTTVSGAEVDILEDTWQGFEHTNDAVTAAGQRNSAQEIEGWV